MRYIVFAMACCASMILIGCSAHSKDYLKQGRQISPLVVPSDVPIIKQEPYYPVPTVVNTAPASPNSLLPPTLKKQ